MSKPFGSPGSFYFLTVLRSSQTTLSLLFSLPSLGFLCQCKLERVVHLMSAPSL